MAKAIKINLDRTIEHFDLKPYPHLHDVLGSHFDIVFVNGPLAVHPSHVTVGIAVDDEGLLKDLELNALATSFRNVFKATPTYPVVGVAVLTASDIMGDHVDLPEWAGDLIDTIKRCTDVAFQFHYNREEEE